MGPEYLCKHCCDTLDINFSGWAENKVGRKYCSGCGDNDDWELHIMSPENRTWLNEYSAKLREPLNEVDGTVTEEAKPSKDESIKSLFNESVLYFSIEVIVLTNKFPSVDTAVGPISAIWISTDSGYHEYQLLTCSKALSDSYPDNGKFFTSEKEMLTYFNSIAEDVDTLIAYNKYFDFEYISKRMQLANVPSKQLKCINLVDLVKEMSPQETNLSLSNLSVGYNNSIAFMKSVVTNYKAYLLKKLQYKVMENSCYGRFTNEGTFKFYDDI
jgi:DNA polymerase elongation subunit (family B)